jgi:outer membrane protein
MASFRTGTRAAALGSAVAVVSLASAAFAADIAQPAPPPTAQYLAPTPTSDWIITLGAEARALPKFEGDDRLRVLPFPVFRIRKAGTPEKFRSPRDGASIALFDSGPIKFGPTAKVRLGRKESDDNDLRGLGDVSLAFEVGAFAEYWAADWLRTRAEVRQGLGGHHGVVADLTADFVAPVSKQLTVSAGPRVTWSTGAAVSPYFSVTPTQAALSGLPVYDARGGLRSYGAGAQAIYAWTPQWSSNVFIEYERLAGDVANSPLVTLRGSRDQLQFGTGLTYSFSVPGLW